MLTKKNRPALSSAHRNIKKNKFKVVYLSSAGYYIPAIELDRDVLCIRDGKTGEPMTYAVRNMPLGNNIMLFGNDLQGNEWRIFWLGLIGPKSKETGKLYSICN